MNFEQLKTRHRTLREHSPGNLNLRVHRALSWLQRAEMAEDEDGRFIFLWIAFNAAYATEIDDDRRLSEQETFKGFLEKLCDLDEHKQIEQSGLAGVLQQYSDPARYPLRATELLGFSQRQDKRSPVEGAAGTGQEDGKPGARQRQHPPVAGRWYSIASTPCAIS